MPVYKTVSRLTPPGAPLVECVQLIDAPNQAQAIRHVARGIITAELADHAECIELGAQGLKLVKANGAEE